MRSANPVAPKNINLENRILRLLHNQAVYFIHGGSKLPTDKNYGKRYVPDFPIHLEVEICWETGFTHKRTQEFQISLFSIESMIFWPGSEAFYFVTFSFHREANWYFCFHPHFFHFAAMVEIEGFWQLKKSETSRKSVVAFAYFVTHVC